MMQVIKTLIEEQMQSVLNSYYKNYVEPLEIVHDALLDENIDLKKQIIKLKKQIKILEQRPTKEQLIQAQNEAARHRKTAVNLNEKLNYVRKLAGIEYE